MSSPEYSCPRLLATGSGRCTLGLSPPNSPQDVAGLKVSRKLALRQDDCTTRSSSVYPLLNDSPGFVPSSERVTISSKRDPLRLTSTSGRKKPASRERDLNWARKHSEETMRQIGQRYLKLQREETLTTFPLTYKFVIIGN